MADSLARVNAMRYKEGQQLGWHFDLSEFTITLLLQASESGGEFVYRTDLRSPDDPNYAGVARILEEPMKKCGRSGSKPGTLNVFRGLNTPHRVAPVAGEPDAHDRSVFLLRQADVRFSSEERIGFYGRAN